MLLFLFFGFGRMFIHSDEIELCFTKDKAFIPEGMKISREVDEYICWTAKYEGQDFFGRYYYIRTEKGTKIGIPVKAPDFVAFISHKEGLK